MSVTSKVIPSPNIWDHPEVYEVENENEGVDCTVVVRWQRF